MAAALAAVTGAALPVEPFPADHLVLRDGTHLVFGARDRVPHGEDHPVAFAAHVFTVEQLRQAVDVMDTKSGH